MNQILLVEDDRSLSQGICLALKNAETEIIPCYSLKEAKQNITKVYPDLFLLDINLPDGNGLQFLQDIKQNSSVPVIMLTANDMEIDIVTGLEMGADDYITKPFSLAVLRARVNTQLRKVSIQSSSRYQEGAFIFDFDRMEFTKNADSIELSKTEQKLLKILIENKGITMKRSVLVDRIWTDGAEYVDENALSVTIKRLRNKIEDAPASPEYIKTIYGIGYMWTGGFL